MWQVVSIVSIEMSLIFELEKKRKMITTKKCKMLCWDKVFLKMGEEDLRVITNTVRLVSAGVCCSYFTICRSSRSWKSSDKKWLLSDYCCKLRQEFIQFLWTILKINSKWFERGTIGLCSLKCTLVMSQFSLTFVDIIYFEKNGQQSWKPLNFIRKKNSCLGVIVY